MARSGNGSDWQQRLAAQRAEQEQLRRERRQQVRDREKTRQQEILESQQQAADEQTAAVRAQIAILDEVLTSVLSLPPMSFDRLLITAATPPFDPGPLGVAEPGPDWADFAPPEPRGLARFLRRIARFKRQTAQARDRFEAAKAEHGQREEQRQRDLAVAVAKYHKKLTETRARAAARNAYIAGRQSAFSRGEAEAVAWFGRCVLKASRYPDDFPHAYQVGYDRPARTVTVEFELPPRDVVPPVRGYRYVKARDVIEPVPRPQDEVSARHDRLVCAVALRTMHEIFSATTPEVVRAVSFTGYLSTTDQATGKPVRPHLLAVSAERAVFEDLVLAEVEPAACVAGLSSTKHAANTRSLGLGLAVGALEQVQQRAERLEVGPGLLGQRRPVIGIELPGHLVPPVLHCVRPGGAEQPELLQPVEVRPRVHHEARRAASRPAISASRWLSVRGRSFCIMSANAPAGPRNSAAASSTRCCQPWMCSSWAAACSTARAYPEQSAPRPARQASSSAWLCSSRSCQELALAASDARLSSISLSPRSATLRWTCRKRTSASWNPFSASMSAWTRPDPDPDPARVTSAYSRPATPTPTPTPTPSASPSPSPRRHPLPGPSRGTRGAARSGRPGAPRGLRWRTGTR